LNIFLATLWRLAVLSLLALIIGAIKGTLIGVVTFAVGIFIYLLIQLYWQFELIKWFKKPDLAMVPHGRDIWENIFAMIYREARKHARTQQQLSTALERFRTAASALPDGVVVLDEENKIEWSNLPANNLLGLNPRRDNHQPIVYVVRHQDFIRYLEHHTDLEPIKIKSWILNEVTLEIRIISFGSNQKLIIIRDVSQVEKLDMMRRDFIANVSHELRTPLTVVGGFLETISDMDGAISENVGSYFKMMQEQTSRMRMIIEDLLTLSQLENNINIPDEAEINISLLLNTVKNEGEALSQGRHQFSMESDPTILIKGSAQEIHSAFSNLVSNAVRYTPENGTIHLQWFIRHHEAIFSVTDNGIGIAAEHIERLTERFYRVDRGRSRQTGGTGLGLSIVKHILNRHQGRLEISSELNKGSTFSAIFPESRVIRHL
jgi:two-component system, OmpR family, phosphate regulon sensor histidine kinase PhoR